MMTIATLELLLQQPEGAHLEFKRAKGRFNQDKELPDYCAALANEKGGKLILGVSNDRKIVGTEVFQGTLQTISHELFSKLKIRIEVQELFHPNGRVVVFDIPSRPAGQVIKSTGSYTYPMRVGESLVEMDSGTLKKVLNETEEYTTTLIRGVTVSKLDVNAMDTLRVLWARKAGRKDFLKKSYDRMLSDLSLIDEGEVTYAALILFGKPRDMDRYLPGAEIIFEWRADKRKTSHDFRKNWKEGFLNIFDDIWITINARNIRIPYQEGFVQREIWAFDEKSIREAVLNAVTHRDYRESGRSIFIKASPDEFLIESPGGFFPPVTVNNILTSCAWRNRRLAETFEKAGLVERSGQGVDDIFEKTLRDGKGAPVYSSSNDDTVRLIIPAKVRDKKFILFLERIANEKQLIFTPDEILELENIRKEQKIRSLLHKDKFLQLGIIENIGKGRGSIYILSHQYYQHEGRPGIHTRLVGTTREEKKLLIFKHLQRNAAARLVDFQDIFPSLSKRDIRNLLQELRQTGSITFKGTKRKGRWMISIAQGK